MGKLIAIAVALSTGCVAHGQGAGVGGGNAQGPSCGVDLGLAGEVPAQYTISIDYTPKDRSGATVDLREMFDERLAADLAGHGFTIVQAQGTQPTLYIGLVVVDMGSASYRMAADLGYCPDSASCAQAGDWGISYEETYPYTDPDQMVTDLADGVADRLVRGCRDRVVP